MPAELLTIVVKHARSRWSFDAGYRAQIFIDGADVMVTHVMECWPGHDLQEIAVERRWNTVRGHRRGARRMQVVQVYSCPNYLEELRK